MVRPLLPNNYDLIREVSYDERGNNIMYSSRHLVLGNCVLFRAGVSSLDSVL